MVGSGKSVKRTRTPAVGFNCLHHLARILLVFWSSEGPYLKNYLVIFCMYVFIPTLDGAIHSALIIDPHSLFPVYWGIFHGILLACSLQIYVLCALYVTISLCMFSQFHSVLGRAILPVTVDRYPQFLPCLWRVI